jgi:hypothetical protein
MRITLHEALSKIKTIDKRLNNAAVATFVIANRHNNTRIDGKDIPTVTKELIAAKQRFEALVNNRRILKNAIAMSNAVTKITVAGKEYTVVEAIEEKHFAENRLAYLRSIRRNYETAQNTANTKNAILPDAAEKFVASLNMSEKNGSSKEDIRKTMETYIADNTWELIDPNKVGEWITAMDTEITDFVDNIDFKLSESNATTVIEVELNDEE